LLLVRRQANNPGADSVGRGSEEHLGHSRREIIHSSGSLPLRGSIHSNISPGTKELTGIIYLPHSSA